MNLYAPAKQNHALFEKYRGIIDSALEAVHKREYYSQYPEMPSPQVYGETAEADQKKLFDGQLSGKFDRLKPSHDSWMTSDEQSPYTQQKLGISYPVFADVSKYISASQAQSACKASGKRLCAPVEWRASGGYRRGKVIDIREVATNEYVERMDGFDPAPYVIRAAREDNKVVSLGQIATSHWGIGDVRLA